MSPAATAARKLSTSGPNRTTLLVGQRARRLVSHFARAQASARTPAEGIAEQGSDLEPVEQLAQGVGDDGTRHRPLGRVARVPFDERASSRQVPGLVAGHECGAIVGMAAIEAERDTRAVGDVVGVRKLGPASRSDEHGGAAAGCVEVVALRLSPTGSRRCQGSSCGRSSAGGFAQPFTTSDEERTKPPTTLAA